ncbi:MAG: hypothetical protein IJ083_02755 [Clostridia bacterium]|nr:hypothetical protein [Clostridia bacterium]
MKKLATTLGFLFLALFGLSAYLYMTCTVTVPAVGAVVTEAESQRDLFETLYHEMEISAVPGTVFHDTMNPMTDDPSRYAFVTYTVRLKNDTFVMLDGVEVQLSPMAGDVLSFEDQKIVSVTARSQGEVSVTMLTEKQNHITRELTVTYTLWGYPFSVKTAYRQ